MSLSSSAFISRDQLTDLQEKLAGKAYLPGDEAYDSARSPWNLSYAGQQPALVVMADNAADIVAAINFANEYDLGVALQATGHGIIEPANDALLINTDNMKGVTINPEQKTAYLEAGALWGDVLDPAHEVGLAPLLGSSPTVGAVGYTLGGGMGWLARKYGLAADSVRYFDIVTAGGEQLRVSDSENSDLFWGLRGGRTTFAVVTGMEIDLYPISLVYGGSIIYPAEMAREILPRYREWIAGTPEEITTSVVLINVPEMPGVPEMLQGKSLVMVRACYCGPMEEAESHFQTWQDGPEPIANFLGPMPFSQVAMISQDPEHPMPGYLTGAWIDALDDDVVDILIENTFAAGGPPPLVFSEVRHVGGAKGKVDPDSNAIDHREKSLILNMLGITPSPEAYGHVVSLTSGILEALGSHKTGIYPNFLEGSEGQKLIAEAFSPQTYDRLKALKAQYDPQNRFRYGLQF
jgi:FAD/FMN-containing dehydrogenase